MRKARLEDFTRGWFVGDFEPSIFRTKQVEVAVKTYNKGDKELSHYHKIATEITVINKGKVKMNGKSYTAGDIIVISPMEVTDFECLEDSTINTVVKIPCESGDKYIINNSTI